MKNKFRNTLKEYFASSVPADARKSDKFFAALNFSIPLLMGIYLFVNPMSLSAVNEFTYYLSFLALIILLIYGKTNFTLRSPLTPGLVLFSLWAVLGLFITLDFSNTLHDLRGYLLEYLIIFYLLINFYNSRKRLNILSDIIISSAAIFSIGGIIVFYFIERHYFQERFGTTFKEMYTGFMCFTTVFAATLSLHGFYKARSKANQLVYSFCFLILSAATLLTQSRSAIIGFFVSLAIISVNKKKNLIFIIIAVSIILFLPGVKDRLTDRLTEMTNDIRIKIFHLSLEVIKDYPIAGVGYGGQIYSNNKLVNLEKYNANLPERYRQKPVIIASTHNTFLDVAVRTGLVGFALFSLIILTAVWMLWDIFSKHRDEFFRSWSICLFACLAAYMIQAFFNDSLYGTQGILLYVNLAMIGIIWNLARKNQKDSSAEI